MLMAGASPNLSAAKRFQATMRSNNPGIVPDKEGTARTLDAARRWQQSMRMRDPGIVGNATSELSKALVRSAPSEIATRAAGDMVKRESGDIARRASGELVKREAGDIAKRGAGELVKRGAGEIATRGSGEMVKRGAGELAKRGAGELVKVAASEGGKAGVRQAAGQVASQVAGNLGRTAAQGLAMGAAKAVLPIAVVAATAKGAGEFPELEKLRREESENRRYKMQQGMKTGMGNTAPGVYRHETHMTGLKGEYKPIEDLTGYAVDLIKKGRNFGEARKLMQGTEKFRGMSDDMKRMALQYYDTWQKNQLSSTNPAGRAKLDAYLASEKKARMDAQAEKDRLAGKTSSPDMTGMRKPIRRAIGME
jgi:hypothetical protein